MHWQRNEKIFHAKSFFKIPYNSMSNELMLSSIQGSFHQGNSKFGETAGMQCSCSSILSICYSKFRKISLWKYHDLDFILNEADKNFKQLGFTRVFTLISFQK